MSAASVFICFVVFAAKQSVLTLRLVHDIESVDKPTGIGMQKLYEAKHKGYVHELITLGAVRAGNFTDYMHESGCFPGVRMWAANGSLVDPAVAYSPFAAPAQNTFSLGREHAEWTPCTLSQHNEMAPYSVKKDRTWALHKSSVYLDRVVGAMEGGLKLIFGGQSKDDASIPEGMYRKMKNAIVFSDICYANSICEVDFDRIAERPGGWRLVGFELIKERKDIDVASLFQNEDLDCALAFRGSDVGNIREMYGINMDMRRVAFCGTTAMRGYVRELRGYTNKMMASLRPKLAQCRTVSAVGHSLGGSTASVFAGCANSGNFDEPDFASQSWDVGTPSTLPSVVCPHK